MSAPAANTAPLPSRGAVTNFGIAITLLILVLGSFLGYRSVLRTMATERSVAHSDSVILGLEHILGDVRDAETGHRGYVITHDSAFLEPYAHALRALEVHRSTVAFLIRDNAAQQKRFAVVSADIDKKIRWVEEGQRLVHAWRYAEAVRAVQGGEGRRLMVSIQQGIAGLQGVEHDLLSERKANSERSFVTMLWTIITSAGVGIILLLIIISQGRRTVVQQGRHARTLQEERELLRVTLASIGDALIRTDERGNVTYLNAVAEALTGWKNDEATGRSLDEVFHIVNETTRQPVTNPALKALQSGAIQGLANHTVLIAKDGSEIQIDDSAAPIKNAEGTVIGSVLIFRDIGAQRRTERELQEQSSLLRTALEAAELGSWALDMTTGTFRSDERYKAIFGTSVTGLTEKEAIGNIHPDDQDRVQVAVTAALNPADPAPYSIEYRVVHPDQSVHWVHAKGSARFTDEGGERKLTGFAGTVMDITERRVVDDALRKAGERLRFVMESMPQKVMTAKPTGEVDYLSPQWLTYTGLTQVELGDLTGLDVLHPLDLQKAADGWAHALRTGEDYQVEYRVRRADGTYRWHLTRMQPMRDADGTIILWVGAATDVHEQWETAEKLRQYAADLSESDRRKNEFLAMLAHELRNPLAPIHNALELLDMGGTDEAARQAVTHMMQRQVKQMVRLVDDLLDVSRVSSGKIALRKEQVELASVVQQAVEAVRPMALAQGQQLVVDLPQAPMVVHGDPARLAQVVGNLLNNASKFSGRDSRVELTARVVDGQAVIQVKDEGIGISASELPRIFDLFVQADTSLERSTSGLGIGLTLVKDLVHMHGGTVEAHSDGLGQGSTFRVQLPLHAERGNGHAPGKVSTDSEAFIGRKVLVVDDNRDAAQTLAMLLGKMGHTVRTAFDGLEAISTAASFLPEVMLLDIGLPYLNGFEVAQRIRREPWGRGITLIALTGWGQQEDRTKSAKVGFDGHLVKPVDFAVLVRLINGLGVVPEGDGQASGV